MATPHMLNQFQSHFKPRTAFRALKPQRLHPSLKRMRAMMLIRVPMTNTYFLFASVTSDSINISESSFAFRASGNFFFLAFRRIHMLRYRQIYVYTWKPSYSFAAYRTLYYFFSHWNEGTVVLRICPVVLTESSVAGITLERQVVMLAAGPD